MAKKLFVGGLSWDTNDQTLSEFFAQSGKVVSANVISDRYTGKSKGFGFVEMETEEEAEAAKNNLDGKELDGRRIAVTEALPPKPRDNNFSGGGGFGGGGRRDDRRGGGGGYGNDRRDRDNRGGRGGGDRW